MPAINKNIKPGEHEAIRIRMMDALPAELALLPMYKFIRVDMTPGDVIKQHKHRHHAVLYYPQPADPIIIHPLAGTLLYMPPDTLHEVPPVAKVRQSFAMLYAP